MKRRDHWYKNAIIYCLDVKTFMDGNGDGIGDFKGLLMRLDQLAALGITCIWLLPFYGSPNRDNGYDVSDYYSIDARLGTLGDFVEFVHRAQEHGIRIMVDLVVNHTSIDHPWFQAARSDPQSKYRNYYLWSQEKPADAQKGVSFPGVQETTWTYDDQAQAYYFHRFYWHQPDLNIANPAVMEEIFKIMGFWLQLGVSGFRVDAAPFLIEFKGPDESLNDDPHIILRRLRDFLSWRRGDAIILAEANVPMDQVPFYFGDGDKLQMLFHFILMQNIYLALARGRAEPIIRALKSAPPLPDTAQWAIFLRNHDELTLDKLSEPERQEVFQAFGPEPNMQIYGRGIRRRLAPMLKGDLDCLKLVHSLMLSLPGTPVLWYGQEIGMGDDLSLVERNSVRTPMQWSNEKNGGFSAAPPEKLIRPVINQGDFGYERVNFEAQDRDVNSLLSWIEKVIRVRKASPEIGYGDWRIIETNQPSVLAHCCDWDTGVVIALHNFSADAVTVTLNFEGDVYQYQDCLSDQVYDVNGNTIQQVELGRFGFRWFRLKSKSEKSQDIFLK